MPTASYLIADMQAKLGDPSGNIFTSANLLNWLTEAQTEFCTNGMPLRTVDATIIGTGFQRFPIPSNKIMMEGVFSRNSIGIKMKALDFDRWNTQNAACPGARGHDSDSWTEFDQTLYVFPAYGCAPAACLLGASITATDVTIPVNTTAGFKQWGRLLLGSEEIEYSGIDGTHFYNCVRGLANSFASPWTPPSGGAGVMIQQCDLWMVYRRNATALATVTDTPEIRSVWHEHLEYYAMYLALTQVGETDRAQAMYGAWQDSLKAAQYSAMREHLGRVGVLDTESQLMNSLDGPR